MIIADREYPKIFHSPGLEPWVLGILLRVKPNSLVDVGCGYGFWGFIVGQTTLLTLIWTVKGQDCVR